MLDTTTAENKVLTLLNDMATRNDQTAAEAQQTRRDYAHQLVGILAELMRSGTVTGTVSTTGPAGAQTGTILTSKIA